MQNVVVITFIITLLLCSQFVRQPFAAASQRFPIQISPAAAQRTRVVSLVCRNLKYTRRFYGCCGFSFFPSSPPPSLPERLLAFVASIVSSLARGGRTGFSLITVRIYEALRYLNASSNAVVFWAARSLITIFSRKFPPVNLNDYDFYYGSRHKREWYLAEISGGIIWIYPDNRSRTSIFYMRNVLIRVNCNKSVPR